MGCCCSKSKQSSTFQGEGHKLGTAGEDRDARSGRAAAAEQRMIAGGAETHEPYSDDRLTDEDRARIREERLAAAEKRLTKEEKKAMKQKKKTTSDEPLRGPNSQNTMRWTAG
mmetsp:Transcript_16723/g.35028  ORF Transcript_16723/g.35028 Transcript_16723/m.35028 type:complete len:113 (+) Transcript_16723:63-401(+)